MRYLVESIWRMHAKRCQQIETEQHRRNDHTCSQSNQPDIFIEWNAPCTACHCRAAGRSRNHAYYGMLLAILNCLLSRCGCTFMLLLVNMRLRRYAALDLYRWYCIC